MISIGDKVKFNPFKDVRILGLAGVDDETVKGKVIEVYPEHRWFAVEYFLGKDNTRLRTSFKFSDIDKTVFPCK